MLEPVILESPYKGDMEVNAAYAKRCMLDSLARGEAPFVSHLLYTQVLDDTRPRERKTGMEAGWAWIGLTRKTVVYQDYEMSDGMLEGIRRAKELGHDVEYRNIGKNDVEKLQGL